MTKKYKHVEAYCLMTYKCEQCGETEIIWNSRDGVTPFIIGCRKCKGAMQHIDWHKDFRVKDHIPKDGQRVFIDMPESVKELIARRRIQRLKGNQYEVPADRIEEVKQSIIDGMREGTPYLISF